MTQLLKVQNLFLSSDGFGAGEGQSLERPFGHANPAELASWAGATASWPNRTEPGGSRGLDDYFTRDFANNIGAEIMGRNKFSPYRGPHDLEWQGWWGDEPPFHTPVFVLTHFDRTSFTLSDTTFHFVSGEPAAVLEQARAAAEGRDVRLGGGVTTIREFLEADLVDTMHVAVSRGVTLGSGVRLWESPDELLDRFHLEVVPSPSGVVHHIFWRR
ncbi:dihydrofolate reductase family protein [Blastococcus haudaquaticus]|uniref:RibD C-terminal domain-containing protein n=1 Tax=Blastococcus haudaquaticus TaxID=1938745 RepID=A0A286H6V6_9ACTN|nr:dihydrofolate reductase family protein [Blastococcus haudaquaticus]SOE03481.1 RibD C-terminal domain-containing protein [Blastococcus haudaquaticus]